MSWGVSKERCPTLEYCWPAWGGDSDSTEPAKGCPPPNTSRQWGWERIRVDGRPMAVSSEGSWAFPELWGSHENGCSSGTSWRQGLSRECSGSASSIDGWCPLGKGSLAPPCQNSATGGGRAIRLGWGEEEPAAEPSPFSHIPFWAAAGEHGGVWS